MTHVNVRKPRSGPKDQQRLTHLRSHCLLVFSGVCVADCSQTLGISVHVSVHVSSKFKKEWQLWTTYKVFSDKIYFCFNVALPAGDRWVLHDLWIWEDFGLLGVDIWL